MNGCVILNLLEDEMSECARSMSAKGLGCEKLESVTELRLCVAAETTGEISLRTLATMQVDVIWPS